MLGRIYTYLKNFDWILFFAILLLVCFGLAEIYSVALGRGGTDLLNFKKQIIFVIIGLIIFFGLAFFDYYNLRGLSPYIYVAGVLMLIAVLVLGKTVRGTGRWFYVLGLGIQPVEFIKVALILFLAKYFSGASLRLNPLKHLLLSGLGASVLFILVLLQPDFGSAMLLFALWLFILLAAGFKKRYFAILFLILAVLGAGAWMFYFKPYQKERILTFINPSSDPLKQGYNVTQAMIAVGAGRTFGQGIGFGSQSQLKFLPESQTDFIFAVISEELGFLGVALVIFFFSVIFYRSLASLKRINNDFGIFFVLGSVGLIFIEMFINIGMNMGIVPVVGFPLPFLSYGGSGIISNLAMFGVIESIIIRSKIR